MGLKKNGVNAPIAGRTTFPNPVYNPSDIQLLNTTIANHAGSKFVNELKSITGSNGFNYNLLSALDGSSNKIPLIRNGIYYLYVAPCPDFCQDDNAE